MKHSPVRIVLLMQGGVEWIGGLQYIENLVLALATSRQPNERPVEINVLTTRRTTQIVSASSLSPAAARFVHRTYFAEDERPRYTILQRIWRKFQRDVLNVKEGPQDAFFNRTGFDFAYPYLTPARHSRGVRSAAWIWDFQHKALPQYFSAEEIRRREEYFSAIAATHGIVVLSSRTGQADFHRWYPDAKAKSRVLNFRAVPEDRWFTDTPETVYTRYNLPERFVLVCNQFWKHKNHLLVFEALHVLRSRGVHVNVVCTGHLYDDRDPTYTSKVLQAVQLSGLARQVYLLGLLPRDEQIQLMRQAVGLVQPSLFEGWSSVVEDARCLGKPVVLSDIPVHREQNPPGAAYFDPADAAQAADRIAEMWAGYKAGPDRERERIALDRQREHLREYAETFLRIAAER